MEIFTVHDQGFRLFYFSLVKMVVHIAKERKRFPNWQELEHAIRRNFGGLLEEDFNPVKIIMAHLGFPSEYLQVRISVVINIS